MSLDLGTNLSFSGINGDVGWADSMRGNLGWNLPNAPLVAPSSPLSDLHGDPTGDFCNPVTANPDASYNGGTFAVQWTGQGTINGYNNAFPVRNLVYNSATNTTTALCDLNPPQANFVGYFGLKDTRRTSSAAVNSGVTNFRMRRPIAPGSSTPHGWDETWNRTTLAFLDGFTCLRNLNVANTNNITKTPYEWADRLPATSYFQGSEWSLEWQIHLCNTLTRRRTDGRTVDLWACIPFGASPDYLLKFYQCCAFGSDGTLPYTGPVGSTASASNPRPAPAVPVFEPLLGCLWTELGNEIWNFLNLITTPNQNAAVSEVAAGTFDWGLAVTKGKTPDYSSDNPVFLAQRRYVGKAMVASEIGRSVFGDAAFGTRFCPTVQGQLGTPAVAYGLQYAEIYGTRQVNQYFTHVGTSWYETQVGLLRPDAPALQYDFDTSHFLTPDQIIASGLPPTWALFDPTVQIAARYGLGIACYEGGLYPADPTHCGHDSTHDSSAFWAALKRQPGYGVLTAQHVQRLRSKAVQLACVFEDCGEGCWDIAHDPSEQTAQRAAYAAELTANPPISLPDPGPVPAARPVRADHSTGTSLRGPATYGPGRWPGTQALASGVLPLPGPLTMPVGCVTCWFQCTTTTGYHAILGSANPGQWFGVSSGKFAFAEAGGGLTTTAVNVADGLWHYAEFWSNATSVWVFLDGAMVGHVPYNAAGQFTFGADSNVVTIGGKGSGSEADWSGGLICDLQILAAPGHTAPYTVPTAPTVPTAYTVALFPLNGSGVDSNYAAGPFVGASTLSLTLPDRAVVGVATTATVSLTGGPAPLNPTPVDLVYPYPNVTGPAGVVIPAGALSVAVQITPTAATYQIQASGLGLTPTAVVPGAADAYPIAIPTPTPTPTPSPSPAPTPTPTPTPSPAPITPQVTPMQTPLFCRYVDRFQQKLVAAYVKGTGTLLLDDASGLGSFTDGRFVRLTVATPDSAQLGATYATFRASARSGNTVSVTIDPSSTDVALPVGSTVFCTWETADVGDLTTAINAAVGSINSNAAAINGLAAVAQTGSYADLLNQPPLSPVATSGRYADLTGVPQLGSLATQSGTFSGASSGTNTGDQTITLTGDVLGSGTGSLATTLASSGVTAGSYAAATITVDAKGRVTAAAATTLVAGTTGSLQYNNGGVLGGTAITTDGASSLVTTGSELKLGQTGDEYGPIYLHLINRDGANGAKFENAGLPLIDFIFANTGSTGAIRFESRPNYLSCSINTSEFQLRPSIYSLALSLGNGANVFGGYNGFGVNTPLATLHVVSAIDGACPARITQAGPGATAHLDAWRNSTGTTLSAIDYQGSFHPPQMTDSAALAGSIYYSTTLGKLAFKDPSGTVHPLYS